MGFPFGQVVGVDVNNVATDWLGRVQGQRQIFVFRVQSQVFLVDGPLINRIRTRVIDDFAV